ncbi:MAG: hypothetical protein M1834_005696 [Cirrosporium novae-zelandiae]|nr:MAG: hypothetical protein M1834_005696 [Cirrosporium novae-zelandiae]
MPHHIYDHFRKDKIKQFERHMEVNHPEMLLKEYMDYFEAMRSSLQAMTNVCERSGNQPPQSFKRSKSSNISKTTSITNINSPSPNSSSSHLSGHPPTISQLSNIQTVSQAQVGHINTVDPIFLQRPNPTNTFPDQYDQSSFSTWSNTQWGSITTGSTTLSADVDYQLQNWNSWPAYRNDDTFATAEMDYDNTTAGGDNFKPPHDRSPEGGQI